MKLQLEAPLTQEISGVVDAMVTTNRGTDGSLAFHLVVGPADHPQECDRIEFVLGPEHARALFGSMSDWSGPASHGSPPMPCRVGVELNTGSMAR
ncbi:hypothetical protein AB0436_09725 [Streptomyces sp. NPDC051322]|uniref:hypothetical protein n=1 Tax=Streptomyces sp. NPDC051322 TaxID=3154645 RepID=UPI00344C9BAE